MMNQYPAKPMMDQMAQYGRYGDSMLVHMNPVEVAGIASLSPTGQLTTNPVTGQPEAFLPLLFGGLGSLLKLTPLMTGVLSGVGTAAVTGDLKRGLISGLTAGFAGAAGDAMELGNLGSAAEAGTATADTIVSGGAETLAGAVDPAAVSELATSELVQAVPGSIDPIAASQLTTGELAQAIPGATVDAAPTILDQAREAIPDVLKERPDFLKNVAPDFAPTFTQALVPAAIGQSTLEQMDVQEDFERAANARMAEAEEKKAQATADLQFGYAAAQPDALRGRSPMRDRMDRYIRDYGTDLYAAGGGQMPTRKMAVGGGAFTLRQVWQASGSPLTFEEWKATLPGEGGQGGQGGNDTTPAVTTDTLGPINVTPTEQEAAVLAAAKGNTALSPEDQQILEGYYNRYEQERQNRASQITDTGSDFDLGAIAAATGQFGYTPELGLGGIDPVTIQAGLRGDYVVRPPDDYMPGFEAEFSYFQDDPNAPFMPYRGYRPTTGGITPSDQPYFDPILDRGSYKKKLAEYYTTLASYGLGTGPDDPETGVPADPGDGGDGTDDGRKHIGWIWNEPTGDWVKMYDGQSYASGAPQVLSVQKPLDPPEGFGDDNGGDDSGGTDDGREHIGWIWKGSPGKADGEWVKIYRGQTLPSSVPQVFSVQKPLNPPEGFGVDAGGDGDAETSAEYEARIQELMDKGMTREQAIANQSFAISSGYDLNDDGIVTDAEYREAIGSAGDGTEGAGTDGAGTEGTSDIDLSKLPDRIRELIESGQLDLDALRRFYGGFGGLGLGGYNPAVPPQTTPAPPKEPTSGAGAGAGFGFDLSRLPPEIRKQIESGQFNPANFAQGGGRGPRRMNVGGVAEEGPTPDVRLQTSLGEARVPGGGIAEVETQFTARPERAEMPTKEEMDILAMAVMGEVSEEQQDMIVSAFTEKYGAEMYAMLRSEILRSVMPDAQTEGMIRGNGGGMDDKIPGMIGAQQPVAVSPGEFIVPADVVSDLGDGNSDSGADELYAMMERVRKARGGNGEQPPAINARRNMPA
jgi:hypothetical protein